MALLDSSVRTSLAIASEYITASSQLVLTLDRMDRKAHWIGFSRDSKTGAELHFAMRRVLQSLVRSTDVLVHQRRRLAISNRHHSVSSTRSLHFHFCRVLSTFLRFYYQVTAIIKASCFISHISPVHVFTPY